jgi:hypothetical protein
MTTTQIVSQLTGTAAEIRGQLAEQIETIDDGLKTIADITAVLDEQEELLVLGTFKQAAAQDPRIDSAWIAMSVNGIQLSTDERQGLIDSLATAGSWPNATREKVKALGRPLVTRWQSLGGTGEIPSVETIQAILDTEATKAWWAAKSAVVAEGLHGLTITTKAQVRDVIGGD